MIKRRIVNGIVVSNKMQKTVVVKIKRLVRHPLYEKAIKKVTRLLADDPENKAKIGDEVELVETRPLSKLKRWRIFKIVEKV